MSDGTDSGAANTSGGSSGDKLVASMGHPQEKTKMGNFIGAITGANKVEKYLDKAWNYVSEQDGTAPADGAAAGAAGGGGAAQGSSAATQAQK